MLGTQDGTATGQGSHCHWLICPVILIDIVIDRYIRIRQEALRCLHRRLTRRFEAQFGSFTVTTSMLNINTLKDSDWCDFDQSDVA